MVPSNNNDDNNEIVRNHKRESCKSKRTPCFFIKMLVILAVVNPISMSSAAFITPKTKTLIHRPSVLYNQDGDTATATKTSPKPCSYRYSENSRWMKRVELKDLKVGQQLKGIKLNQDLLNGKTGPKVFFECGVGRIDANQNWQIVNGMCRLGTRFKPKASVIRKRISKLKKQAQMLEPIDLYVSKIRLDNQQLEVSLSPPSTHNQEDDSAEKDQTTTATATMISASKLQPNQELLGTVVEVRDYGVVVDVNANRNGLLHIQKVADLFGRYIDKSKGLEEAGLERGATIRVSVCTNEKKRLFLDFTSDVKQEAEQELKDKMKAKEEQDNKQQAQEQIQVRSMTETTDTNSDEASASASDEGYEQNEEFDAAAWAEFAAAPDYNDEEEYDDDDDDDYHDEDRNIEDSLGLGSY